ncbi:uncharacterized protein V6R79_011618, partial [Siganus canaliculatus]
MAAAGYDQTPEQLTKKLKKLYGDQKNELDTAAVVDQKQQNIGLLLSNRGTGAEPVENRNWHQALL